MKPASHPQRFIFISIGGLIVITGLILALGNCSQQPVTTETSTSTTISTMVSSTTLTTTVTTTTTLESTTTSSTTTTTTSSTTTTPPSPLSISSITFSKESINTSETVSITCNATSETGVPLTYSWSSLAGALSSSTGKSVNWTAPTEVNNYLITVEVSDGSNLLTRVATAYVETDVSASDAPQIVYYMSQDSKIGGVLRRSDGTNLPAFIYTHGGSDPADLTGNPYTYAGDCIPDNVRSLYGQPCVVLAAGNYGDQPFQTGVTLTTELKQNFYKDIQTAIDYLKRKTYVNKNKIAVFGESRGGYNTVRLLENNTSDIKAAAAWAVPVTKSWCDPAITSEVNKITTPLLNLHHISDETVAISDGRLLRDTFYSIFGASTTQYTYEELTQEGTVIGSFLVFHPGPYDWSFKTTTPWMTKTIQYLKDKGM